MTKGVARTLIRWQNVTYVLQKAVSLDFEVTSGRSLATDKSLFPRGALTFVATTAKTDAPVNRLFLDQDTGGAIRTAGRADIYTGIGDEAEAIAGRTKIEGQLYYLFVKE